MKSVTPILNERRFELYWPPGQLIGSYETIEEAEKVKTKQEADGLEVHLYEVMIRRDHIK